ncbi:MAG: hypothetical protein IJH63_10415 [Methanobrevibacter sp.]|nr:hypothetical protein [Methanosphaera sp.]MBR0371113.1 hypothetical protein [Methanobrevibacter sp.]
MSKNRFVKLLDDEIYYLVDTKGLKSLEDFKEEYYHCDDSEEFSEDEVLRMAMEDYYEYLYEYSLTADENLALLNNFNNENGVLEDKNQKLQKWINHYAFITECSIQVLNEEEGYKEDGLAIAANNLYSLGEENKTLRNNNISLENEVERLNNQLKLAYDKINNIGEGVEIE